MEEISEKEKPLIQWMEKVLDNLKSSNLKTAREKHAVELARRKDAGAFPKLARLIIFIEDLFEKNNIYCIHESNRSLSRYYAESDWNDLPIRLSDHEPNEEMDTVWDIYYDEDMTNEKAEKAVTRAIKILEDKIEKQLEELADGI